MDSAHAASTLQPAPRLDARPGFRADIEGLRALAVLPILFNHLQVKGFAGGFIGVDIFFVISGFLITGILQRDLGDGRYSIAGFYRRRILRILPALLVMLVAVTGVSFLAMAPNELAGFARSALATAAFASNIYFYADTGYFTLDALNRPLLHTWSLAVEEQFYILWPIILAACVRWKPGSLKPVVAGICLVSLLLSVWMVDVDMSAAFYLIPFRAWELAIGGMLALILPQIAWPRHIRSLIGVAALGVLLYCIHEYREPIRFPGLNALLPCLATAALILAGPDALAGRLLAFSPVRFFGRISYSLYLWHWPVIVFGRLWFFLPQTPAVIAGELALSILLGWLSCQLIEGPASRRLGQLRLRTLLIGTGGAMAAAGAAMALIVFAHGFPGRFAADRVAMARILDSDGEAAYRRGSCFAVEANDRFDHRCLDRQGAGPTLVLVGDSMAAHYWPGLDRVASDRYDIRQATMIGCRPLLYPAGDTRRCARFFREILGSWSTQHRPDAIVLSGYWVKADLPLLEHTLAGLRQRGQKVILLGPMPTYDAPLPRLLFFAPRGQEAAFVTRHLTPGIASMDATMQEIAARTGAGFISPYRLLCPQGQCRIRAAGAAPMQFDRSHLTATGSAEVIRLMMPALTMAAPPSASSD